VSPFSYRGTFKLAPGVDGKAWLARAGDMARQPWVKTLIDGALTSDQMEGRRFAFTVENDGGALVTRMSLAPGKSAAKTKAKTKTKTRAGRPGGDPDAAGRAMLDAWFSKPFEVRTVAAGNRILMACGDDTKAQIARMLDPGDSARTPSQPLARTLASTKGSWGFEHLDFAALIRMSLALANVDPQVARTTAPVAALLEGAAAPVHVAWSGGGELSSTFTIPMETAAWVASIVPRVMAMLPPGATGPR
jgi:hypothetical protein